jgi:hypothetical protein
MTNANEIVIAAPSYVVYQTDVISSPAEFACETELGIHGQTLRQAIQVARIKHNETNDTLLPLSELIPSVNNQGKFCFVLDGKEYIPNDNAVLQIAKAADIIGGFCLDLLRNREGTRLQRNGSIVRDAQDSETLVAVYNNALRRLPQNKKFVFRTRNDGTLRAMVSDRYTSIPNVWLMEQVLKIVPDALFAHWYGNSDSLYVNLLIPSAVGKEFIGGLHLSNCEVGIRQCDTMLSALNPQSLACYNFQPKGSKGIKGLHRGKIDLDDLGLQVQDNVHRQLTLLPKVLSEIASSAASPMLNNFQDTLKFLGVDKKVADEIRLSTGSPLDLATAVSLAGQMFDCEVRFQCEGVAGNLLTNDRGFYND